MTEAAGTPPSGTPPEDALDLVLRMVRYLFGRAFKEEATATWSAPGAVVIACLAVETGIAARPWYVRNSAYISRSSCSGCTSRATGGRRPDIGNVAAVNGVIHHSRQATGHVKAPGTRPLTPMHCAPRTQPCASTHTRCPDLERTGRL